MDKHDVFAELYRVAWPIPRDSFCYNVTCWANPWAVNALNEKLVVELGRLKKKFMEVGSNV